MDRRKFSTSRFSRMRSTSFTRLHLLVLLLLLSLITGCRSDSAQSLSPEQSSADGVLPGLPLSESQSDSLQQPSNAANSLVLWVPPFVSINTGDRADAVLAAALAEFAPTATGAPVTLIAKAEAGPAGILPYLITTSRVAPKLLPDIVLLKSFDLPRVIDLDLLIALSAEEAALFSQIPDQVLQTAQWQGSLYGLPFVANLEHLVYQKDRLPQPPATWDAFLAGDNRLLFAGGSVDDYSIPFLWTLYLLGGGKVDGEGNLNDLEILRAALEFLTQGRELGLIPDSALTLSNPQAVWTFFVNGNAEMAVVPASLYNNQQNKAGSIGFAQLPTPDETVRSVVTSWSFAIITQEPERRQRALRLLQQLFAPHVQGEWSRAAQQLPTQPDAFTYWDTGDPYTLFLQEMLTNSVAPPDLQVSAEIDRTMQQAQRDLLAGEKSPDQVLDSLPTGP